MYREHRQLEAAISLINQEFRVKPYHAQVDYGQKFTITMKVRIPDKVSSLELLFVCTTGSWHYQIPMLGYTSGAFSDFSLLIVNLLDNIAVFKANVRSLDQCNVMQSQLFN